MCGHNMSHAGDDSAIFVLCFCLKECNRLALGDLLCVSIIVIKRSFYVENWISLFEIAFVKISRDYMSRVVWILF